MQHHRVTRSATGAVIALALALLSVAPAAAAQPVMDRFESHPSNLAAGEACPFEIDRAALPGGFDMTREYSDGRFVFSAHVDILLTNPANGKTFVHRAKFNGIDRYDPATGIDLGVTDGQVLMQFLPGDMGPFGIVGENGALYRFVGNSWYTWSDEAGRLIDFGYRGTVTDVCALLA